MASHVQTAEVDIRVINLLAPVSACYTLDRVKTAFQLKAAHLVAVPRALDLRALHKFSRVA